MQRDIIELIDTLVKMAGSTTNYETLSSELDEIKKLITKKEIDLQELKESMVNDKYFDASGEVVDRNIEISLTKKIKRLTKMLEDIQDELNVAKSEETTLHDEIKKLKAELNDSSNYIDVIEERIANTNSNEIKDNYHELLAIERGNYSTIEVNLEEKSSEYEKVLKQIEALSVAYTEMEATIKCEQEKLAETKANLSNPKTYIDEDARKSDEEKLNKLIEEIDELDKKRLSIITDPALIANDVKELVASDDKTNSLIKLKELITLVKSKPYMEEANRESLEALLKKLEEQVKELMDSVAAKKYNGQDNSLIEERINYLKNIIELAKINIDQIRENITIIDTQRVSFIKNKITNAESVAKEIEESIEEYRTLINSGEKRSEKSAASLKSAYNKKLKELDTVKNIINAYKEDLRALIKEAFDLENVEIKGINEEIKEYEAEISKLNKLMVLNSKTKDVIAEEKDKTQIRELNDQIKDLQFRLSFDKTPDEIYDDIEMILGSIGFVENKRTSKYRGEKFTFEKLEPEIKLEPTKSELVEPMVEHITSAVEDVSELNKESFVQEELPTFNPNEQLVNNSSNRLKVIEIIPLDNKDGEVEPTEKESDYMINNFGDNDYMGFDDAFNASTNGGN